MTRDDNEENEHRRTLDAIHGTAIYGNSVERAKAYVADVRYLYDRLAATERQLREAKELITQLTDRETVLDEHQALEEIQDVLEKHGLIRFHGPSA